MDCSDIDGAKPRVKRELAQRDSFNVCDIDGARPKKKFQRRDVHD